MVLGILGLVLCWVPFVGAICALVGIILGALGIGKAKRVGAGKGMAIAGLVCGIVGIAVGIFFIVMTLFVASTIDYMKKSKSSEATLNLHSIERHIKMVYNEKGSLPPSASTMPGAPGSACVEPGAKLPIKSQSEWDKAGWGNLDFSVMEPSRYSYTWTKISDTEGEITAAGDLDCDTTISTTKVRIEVNQGNISASYGEPTPD